MRGRKNPLLNKSRTHGTNNRLPVVKFGLLKIKAQDFQGKELSLGQKKARSYIQKALEDGSNELAKAIDTWLCYTGGQAEFAQKNPNVVAKLGIDMPFASKELMQGLKENNKYSGDKSAASPYLAPGFQNVWYLMFFKCVTHGPDGERLALEKLYPALLKFQELKNKYNPQKAGVVENITGLIGYLARWHENGEISPADAIKIRTYFDHRCLSTPGRKWEYSADIANSWDCAQTDFLKDLSLEKDEVTRLKALLAFNQQLGIPRSNKIAEYLQSSDIVQ